MEQKSESIEALHLERELLVDEDSPTRENITKDKNAPTSDEKSSGGVHALPQEETIHQQDYYIAQERNSGVNVMVGEQYRNNKRGAKSKFPFLLHQLLSDMQANGIEDIISWQPHGRAFSMHDRDTFETQIIPLYFRQSTVSSFQRQLNKYGFVRMTHPGPDQGAYYHPFFLRGREDLCVNVIRGGKRNNQWQPDASHASFLKTEPDFSLMPTVGAVFSNGESESNEVVSTDLLARCDSSPLSFDICE